MIITPPALTILNHHICTSCGAGLPTVSRWAYVLGNAQRGELCLDCAALSPVERAARVAAKKRLDNRLLSPPDFCELCFSKHKVKRHVYCEDCLKLSASERVALVNQRHPSIKWTAETYQDYLMSAHWRQFKAEAYKHYKRKCYLCNAQGKDAQIELHHSTYERLGGELISDVIPLCHDCHSKFHFEL